MTVLFWVLVGLIGYAYIGYPIAIWSLALLAGRRAAPDDAHEPAVSILIPAYNEERVLAAKLDNTLGLDYPSAKREIIVASESDDGTDGVAARYADRGVRLLASAIRRGKVANLRRAVPEARHEILVFTDANAMLRPDALRLLVRNFSDSRVGSVSGRLVYANRAGAASAEGEGAYWGFEMMVKRASSALGSLPGANGSLFALRKDLYRPISDTRGDDFELPIRVILQGRDPILEPRAVTVEEAAERFGDEYRRKVRIVHWMSASAMMLLSEAIARHRWLVAFQLLSHKLNRWAVPFWLIALLPVSLALAPRGGAYLAAAGLQALVYALGLAGLAADRLGLRPPTLLSLPLYFIVVNAASMVGILSRLTGRRVTWHKRPDAAP